MNCTCLAECKYCSKNEQCECEEECIEMSFNYAEHKKDWLIKQNLNLEFWAGALVGVPRKFEPGNEFYIKMEHLGNKHFVDAEHEKNLIEWMRLTEKLF